MSNFETEKNLIEKIESLPEVYSQPAVLFLIAVGLIFFAEFVVMILLSLLPKSEPVIEGLLDASLLSIIIVPALYLFVYRPLKANIIKRQHSELHQQQMLEVDRVKNQFISTAAHELRTPLTSVMGYSELLLSPDEVIEEDRQLYLETIFEKSVVLGRLVDDLVDLSRIDSGQVLRVEVVESQLIPIVENVLHYFRYTIPDRVIEAEVPEEMPSLQIDPVRIGQVLENLIGNAIKYSPEGSPVKLSVEIDKLEARITVVDRGFGMTPKQLDKIFEKFYRVDSSNTATGGLGLGLTIVKEIVEGHGGSVQVDSVFGQGTSIQVTLPRT